MALYFILPVVTSFFAVILASSKGKRLVEKFFFLLLTILAVLFIGGRTEVGKDWEQYNYIFSIAKIDDFHTTIGFSDPSYMLINWICSHFEWGINGVFFICAGILLYGVYQLSRLTTSPMLVLMAAYPHLLSIMAMDHVRQATAFGILCFALVSLLNEKKRAFIFYVVIAATFHKTAILMLLLSVFFVPQKQRFMVPIMLFFAVICSYILLVDSMDVYVQRYIGNDYGAAGALFRLLQNIPPALFFLMCSKEFNLSDTSKKALKVLCYAAMLFPMLLYISPSTIIIDRFGKYLILVQLYVYGNMPKILFENSYKRYVLTFLLVCYFIFYQYFWFVSSELADSYWIPYKNVLL